MSEKEPEVTFEEPEPEVADGDSGEEPPTETEIATGDDGGEDDEPGEDDAEASSSAEREAELAAEREAKEQQAARDDADIERRQKQLVRAADAYVKKIVDALGPDLDGAKPCPLCADFFPGFRFPIMPPPENLSAVRVAIGLDPGDNLQKDNYSRLCEACDGWGKVKTGSRVSGQDSAMCYDCAGRGWIAVGIERASGAITAGVPAAPAATNGPPVVSSNDPPEVEKLKQLGYVVVPPIQPIETPQV